MNFHNSEIYFFWFLICCATAKHLQLSETSPHNQRLINPFLKSNRSRDLPKYSSQLVLNETVESLQASVIPQSPYSPRGFSTQSRIVKRSSQYSEQVARRNERTLSEVKNSKHKLNDSDLVKRHIKKVSTNVTQSNETNIDESSERDGIDHSRDLRTRTDDVEEMSEIRSYSTTVSVDSNSIQKYQSEEDENIKLDDTRALKRVFLTNRSIVCNDGSQAGFYLRRSTTGSSVWIVFLEGGWYCHDRASCRSRWMRLRHLMTSAHWPETKDVSGILSPHASENPYWHEANHVFVPYCSSDTWSGASPLNSNPDCFKFMGKLIVNQVIRDLVPLGLQNSSWLILAGSSAGGTGVMVNLDPVHKLLKDELGLKKIAVRGISDSGWFLDRTPYSPNTLPAVDAIKKGYELWNGSLPKKCVSLYSQEPWRCYFGYRLYPTIKAPLFVFQWLFDEAQMTADNVGAPVTRQQWDYIYSMGHALRESFANVSAVFAPSCISHSVLTKKDWTEVKIDDVSIAQALRCWELFTMKKHSRKHALQPARRLVKSGVAAVNDGRRDLMEPTGGRHQNRRRKRKKHSQEDAALIASENLATGDASEHTKRENRRLNANKNNDHSKNSRLNRNRHRISKNNYHYNRRNNHPNTRNNSSNRNSQPNIPNCSRLQNIKNNHRLQMKCDTFQNVRRHGKRKVLGGKRGRHHNETINNDHNSGHRKKAERLRMERSLLRNSATSGCEHRHLERCSWPQCSHSCPRLLDPYTGEEVQFIDMLKSFGMSMDSAAKELGVDTHTLNNMDHSELLDLLTQQIS